MQRPAKPCTPVRFRPQPPTIGPGGEIGRRKGLKIPRWQHRAGSSPALGTINLPIIQSALSRLDGLKKLCLSINSYCLIKIYLNLFPNAKKMSALVCTELKKD